VHKNGAGHMERPEKLIESATRIYGEMMDSLWGKFEPVPSNKLNVLEGGEHLKLAGLEFRSHDTPGHATHHLAYQLEDAVFTGDVGGVRLPGSTHVLAPTPPPDIDLEAWRESLQVLRDCNASRLFIAHFGEVNDVTGSRPASTNLGNCRSRLCNTARIRLAWRRTSARMQLRNCATRRTKPSRCGTRWRLRIRWRRTDWCATGSASTRNCSRRKF
jgi:hypothetical protein